MEEGWGGGGGGGRVCGVSGVDREVVLNQLAFFSGGHVRFDLVSCLIRIIATVVPVRTSHKVR